MAAVLTALIAAPTRMAEAQNLGLGTGSRGASDDSAGAARPERQDETPPPRKTQINKRLGLAARRQTPFDPKMFETRGRELQGQFYEIGTAANLSKNGGGELPISPGAIVQQKNGSRQWLIWVGVAGVAGVSAGAIGYFLMTGSHPASAPPDIPLNLDDGP